MKTHTLVLLAITGSIATPAISQVVFTDDYWGGVPTNANYNLDVIGESTVFDITGATLSLGANSLTINIAANYFDNILNNSSSLLGTQMGDLFISTDGLEWTTGGAATLNDYFGSGNETTWEYAVVLDPRKNNQGLLDVFKDGEPNADNAISSEIFEVYEDQILLSAANGIYRANQEYAYDPANQQSVSTASWYISDDYKLLSITLNNINSFLGDASDLGFHWTMSCGNDVIEFAFENPSVPPVPEPSTIGIAAVVGVLAIGLVRRRIASRKK